MYMHKTAQTLWLGYSIDEGSHTIFDKQGHTQSQLSGERIANTPVTMQNQDAQKCQLEMPGFLTARNMSGGSLH